MALSQYEKIWIRAASDNDFRTKLVCHPRCILANPDLNNKEKKRLFKFLRVKIPKIFFKERRSKNYADLLQEVEDSMDNVYYAVSENRLVIADARESCHALDLTRKGKVKNCYLCEADFIKALYCTLDFFSSKLWLQENGRWSFQKLARTYFPLDHILSMVQFVANGRLREVYSPKASIKIPFDQHCGYRLYSGGSRVLDLFLTLECFLQGALDYFLDIKFRRPLDLSYLEIGARDQFAEKWSQILAAEKKWTEENAHQDFQPASRA